MQTQDSHHDKVLKSAKTFFARWVGASAEMRELTVGHRTLRILITRGPGPANLLVACIDPRWIAGPVRWSASKLEASIYCLPGTREQGYRITDETAKVEVICAALEIKENVKL